MSQKNETLPLVLALVITGAILAGGYWWFSKKSGFDIDKMSETNQNNTNTPATNNSAKSSNNSQVISNNNTDNSVAFDFPNSVPQGTTIVVNGSTSMVQINQAIKKGFEREFAGTAIATNGQGTDIGIELLQKDNIDIAAISRPLTEQEQATGLAAVPIARDMIAVVVGINNPFRRSLTSTQVADIFQGKITNWSEVGGKNSTIKVINRPPISGTHQVFQDVALNGFTFGDGANFTTLERDAITPILKALDTDGISYATYTQVANQQTVRTVPIDGITPEANNYPYYRVLYYAYQEPATPQVKAFLGYVLSPQGQRAIASGG